MKFFWKIFFTTMFASISCFTLGGHILLNSNFKTLLNNEVNTAYDYGDIAYYSIANELKNMHLYLESDKNNETISKWVKDISESININNINQKISYCVIDNQGNVIFSSLVENMDKSILHSLKENQKAWILKKSNEKIYVQAIRTVKFWDELFYIETLRDVTFIFNSQYTQYELLLKIIVGMFFLAGIVIFVISKLLMMQVVSLTAVTKDIASGDLEKRVEIKGNDEFTVLSENFNSMADNLKEKIYELKMESEKKELFIGAFSHEIKTPLTSIIGYADIIRRKNITGEKLHICADYIFTEGKRLETLSMRLLEIIVLKNREINYTPISVCKLFEEIYAVVFPQMSKEGIMLTFNIEDAVLKVEPELIKTVFINILDNSRKAIEKKGNINIVGRRIQNGFVVKIKDNGKGMEKQELSKIKEAFYMVDKSRSRKQGGAGLGLSICDEILKLHGFDIHFESAINKGTTVTITMKEHE